MSHDAESLTGRRLGVKVLLYDISDRFNPKVIEEKVIGEKGTRSDVLKNPHGLSFLKRGDQYRSGVSINRFESYQWADSGLYQFSVGLGQKQLTQDGLFITRSATAEGSFVYTSYASSVQHDDAFFLF